MRPKAVKPGSGCGKPLTGLDSVAELGSSGLWVEASLDGLVSAHGLCCRFAMLERVYYLVWPKVYCPLMLCCAYEAKEYLVYFQPGGDRRCL